VCDCEDLRLNQSRRKILSFALFADMGDPGPGVSLLLAALKKDNADLCEYHEEYLRAVARSLYEELHAAPGRIRSLTYNLPRSPVYRKKLLSGALTPRDFCALDWAELASAAVKRQRQTAADKAAQELRRASTGGAIFSLTKSVRCPECGHKRARFTHLGTDLKDWHGRKNEVWGTQNHDDDGLDCELVCTACETSWRGAAPEVYEPTEEEEQDDLEESRRKDLILRPEPESIHKRA
jgi:hypothetical protein